MIFAKIGEWTEAALRSGSDEDRRPAVGRHFESSVRGLYLIGDLAGAADGKSAMEQGRAVIGHIAGLGDAKVACATRNVRGRLCTSCGGKNPEGAAKCRGCGAGLAEREEPEVWDVIVAGAGGAGLSAAVECGARGLRCLVVEKGRMAGSVEDFPDGKWVYSEAAEEIPKGKLWLDGATKEDLVGRWREIIRDEGLMVHVGEGLVGVERVGNELIVRTRETAGGQAREHKARRVVIASGTRGRARRLGVEGEEQGNIHHRLYGPRLYEGKEILIVGGGNRAVEAALLLSERNRVTVSYRGNQFLRVLKENQKKIDEAIRGGRIRVVWNSVVEEFEDGAAVLEAGAAGGAGGGEETRVKFDVAFVLIGAEGSAGFLESLGVRLENEWGGRPRRAAALALGSMGLLLVLGGLGMGEWPGWARGMIGTAVLGGPAALLAVFGKRDRYAWMGVSFLVAVSVYGAAKSMEPFKALLGLGREAEIGFEFLGQWRSGGFFYTAAYCVVMTAFGALAMKRWGLDKRDRVQIARYGCLIACQWLLFFILPEFTYRYVVRATPTDGSTYLSVKEAMEGLVERTGTLLVMRSEEGGTDGVVGRLYPEMEAEQRAEVVKRIERALAREGVVEAEEIPREAVSAALVVSRGWLPERAVEAAKLAEESGRAAGLVYAWPLMSGTFFGSPHVFWAAWGVFLTCVLMPVIVLFQGKRFCSWVCGCGGLAETLGDRWRHLAPKGRGAKRQEAMGTVLLLVASGVLVLVLGVDSWKVIAAGSEDAERARAWHSLIVDVWGAGIVPITLYPFLGGRVWCRFLCPLGKLMELVGRFYARMGWNRFRIESDSTCISCGECSRHCQVGIPVMRYAERQEVLDHATSSCVGCGICVSACPMGTLSFGRGPRAAAGVALTVEGARV